MKPKANSIVTSSLVHKIAELADAGFTSGLGVAKPGKMCVEAAVNYALGADHNDEPECVINNVRQIKIDLNDAGSYKSDKDRGAALKRVAIAQLGSNSINVPRFYQELTASLLPYLNEKLEAAQEAVRAKDSLVERLRKQNINTEIEECTDIIAWADLTTKTGRAKIEQVFDLLDEDQDDWDDNQSTCGVSANAVQDVYNEEWETNSLLNFLTECKSVKTRGKATRILIDAVENALVACGTEGSKFLYLLD